MSAVDPIVVRKAELIRRPKHINVTRIEIDFGDVQRKLWYRVRRIPHLQRNLGDLSAPVVLMTAMLQGRDIVFEEPLSKSRLRGLDQVQEVMTGWYPHRLKRVGITAPRPQKEIPRESLLRAGRPSTRTVSCFTGGVDSFYSLVTHPELGGIVFVDGLDVPLTATDSLKRVNKSNRGVARASGIRYHRVESNVRYFLKHTRISWGFEGHGAALASVATLLSPRYGTFLLPSTHSEDIKIKWGSHPDLDPKWSTKTTQIIHDGGTATRVGKMTRIADDPLAQRFLRVCYMEYKQDNCGRCMKCLRTMATLELLGRLPDYQTFESNLDLDKLADLQLVLPNDFVQFRDLADLGERVGGHDELRKVIAGVIERSEAARAARVAEEA